MHPNEIDLLKVGKEGRRALGAKARATGRAYVEAFNEQVARQAARILTPPPSETPAVDLSQPCGEDV